MVLKHISSGLFRELLTGMIFTNNKSYQLHIDYPVKMMQQANLVKELVRRIIVKKVEIKLFDNMHHDILHEQNYYDVYRFIEGKII